MEQPRITRRAFAAGTLGAAACSLLGSTALAQTTGATPAARAARREWLQPRPFGYRPDYLMFEHQQVDPASRPWKLPRSKNQPPLDFNYEAKGVQYSASAFAERTWTYGLLIIKNGRIVHEQYRAGATENSPLTSSSMSKTVAAILIGIALKEGAIRSLDQQMTDYLPELKGSGYDGVTIRQLIRMRSGIKWDDNFFIPGPSQRIQHDSLFDNIHRYTDTAKDQVRDHEPGEHFFYNSLDSALAGLIVERATKQSIVSYTQEKLWKPLGMEFPAYWLMDGPPGVGQAFVAGGLNAALRDYARLGMMMLSNGVANGRRILDRSFVMESRTPPPGPLQREGLYTYGYFWWLLDGSDAYTARGGLGQYIYVNPEHRTMIVKSSWTPVDPTGAFDDETQAFFKAAAQWKPR